MSDITVVEAVLNRTDHQEAVLHLVNLYTRDPMGSGQALSQDILSETMILFGTR